jgi:hypothetical protein
MTVVVNCYVIRSYKRIDWMVSNVTSGYDWLVIRLSYWLSRLAVLIPCVV